MKNWLRILLIVLSGCGIGFINGFLGGGGGVLVVAVFLALYALPQKNAHATALLVILPISLISALVYLLNGSVDWEYTLFATIGVVAGGAAAIRLFAAGALLLNRLSGNVVKLIFSLLLLASGVRMFL